VSCIEYIPPSLLDGLRVGDPMVFKGERLRLIGLSPDLSIELHGGRITQVDGANTITVEYPARRSRRKAP
jgi:hypothetical protein